MAMAEPPRKLSDEEYTEKYNSETERSSMESGRDNAATDGLLKQEHDIEAQITKPESSAVEHHVSLRSKYIFLAMYFFLNLTLTISNKAVLGKVRRLVFTIYAFEY